MVRLILFLILIITAAFSFLVGFFIIFHFRKLGIDNDDRALKIIKTYKQGAAIIFVFSAFLLILLLVF